MSDTVQRYSLIFATAKPTESELDALEATIDDQMYCGNDVLALVREVRRQRAVFRSALKLMGAIAEQVDSE